MIELFGLSKTQPEQLMPLILKPT